MVHNAVLLDRLVRLINDGIQKDSKKRGIVAQRHARKLAVVFADVLTDPAVITAVDLIFADLQVGLVDLNIT